MRRRQAPVYRRWRATGGGSAAALSAAASCDVARSSRGEIVRDSGGTVALSDVDCGLRLSMAPHDETLQFLYNFYYTQMNNNTPMTQMFSSTLYQIQYLFLKINVGILKTLNMLFCTALKFLLHNRY